MNEHNKAEREREREKRKREREEKKKKRKEKNVLERYFLERLSWDNFTVAFEEPYECIN